MYVLIRIGIDTNISTKHSRKYKWEMQICLFLGVAYYSLCGCSVLTVISLLVNDRFCRCKGCL